MKRSFIFVGLLLPALLAGCVSDREVQALRSDSLSIERQGMRREQELDERLQALNERMTQFEKSNSEARRELAKAAATSEELRSEVQRLHGAMQETRYRSQQRSTLPGESRELSLPRPADGDPRSVGRDSSRPGFQASVTPHTHQPYHHLR